MVKDSVNRICLLLKWAILYKEWTTRIRSGPRSTYPIKDVWSPYFIFFTHDVDLAPVIREGCRFAHFITSFRIRTSCCFSTIEGQFPQMPFLGLLPCYRWCKLKAECLQDILLYVPPIECTDAGVVSVYFIFRITEQISWNLVLGLHRKALGRF